jgi:glycosyltransferase involved in cell wall biosynthesis
VRIVRNGVPVPEPDALSAARHRTRAALGIGRDDVWAAFVGRLTHEKGLDVLLRALGPGAGIDGLLVVGDGPERPALEAAASDCALPVRFCGYHEDVSPFLAAADLFVQPSRSEGLPFSLLEAMAHGLPVIASDVGGIRGALDGSGRLVPAGEPEAMIVPLHELARDRGLRRMLGEAGRRHVARDFGVSAMLQALHETYEGACRAVGRAA